MAKDAGLKLLHFYSWAICYRLSRYLGEPGLWPKNQPYLVVRLPPFDEIQGKARASLATAGVLFGLVGVALAAFLSSDELRRSLGCALRELDWYGGLGWSVGFLLPFLVVRKERHISTVPVDYPMPKRPREPKPEEYEEQKVRVQKTENWNKQLEDWKRRWNFQQAKRDAARRRRHGLLWLFCAAAFLYFIAGPVAFARWPQIVGSYPRLFRLSSQPVFLLSGLTLAITSLFFLFISLEFYDTAGRWESPSAPRKPPDSATSRKAPESVACREARILHCHLASIGSHSCLFGAALALVGVSLLLGFISAWIGGCVAFLAVLTAVVSTEVERAIRSGSS